MEFTVSFSRQWSQGYHGAYFHATRIPTTDVGRQRKSQKASKQCLRKHVPREVFSANQHYLYHIQWIIERLGPLRSTSCKVMERIIGMVKSAMKAPGQPVRVNLFTAPLQYALELI